MQHCPDAPHWATDAPAAADCADRWPDLQPRPCSPPGPRQVPLADPAAQSGCSSAARRKIPPAKAPALAATLLPSHLLPTEIRQSPASSKGQCHQVTLSRNAGFLKEITQVKG